MTRPLSRMRSTTSASPVGLGARWTPPPPPRVASAVVAMPMLLLYFERLPDDAFARDDCRPLDALGFDAVERDDDDLRERELPLELFAFARPPLPLLLAVAR